MSVPFVGCRLKKNGSAYVHANVDVGAAGNEIDVDGDVGDDDDIVNDEPLALVVVIELADCCETVDSNVIDGIAFNELDAFRIRSYSASTFLLTRMEERLYPMSTNPVMLVSRLRAT